MFDEDFKKLNDLRKILQKVGFWTTLSIMNEFRNHTEGIKMKDFYVILNRISYYNSFLRIKDKLIELKLIELIRRPKLPNLIRITEKGSKVFDILTYLRKQLFELDSN